MVTRADVHAAAAASNRDLGPLAWVLGETHKSIASASKSLKHFAREAQAARDVDSAAADASQLRLARQQLHQAAGALEMVGQPLAARMVRGMEAAVQQLVQRPDKCTEFTAIALERAGFALLEYLESQLSEHPQPALGLFPQFRQVQEMAGADRIHPADLWDDVWRWLDPATPPAAQPLAYGADARRRIDQRVLKMMRHADLHAVAELGVISLGLAAGERAASPPAMFWKLCGGFFEALGQALTPIDIYAKRAASRVLLQYTALARGERAVSERLALDLLFFCAQARPAADGAVPALAAVRACWGLDRHAPVEYMRPTFGLYDPAVLAQARRRIETLKEQWSALAGGDMARLKACVNQFNLVGESLGKLHEQGQPLSDALQRVAAQVAQSGRPPSPALAMETATAVLFLEASFIDFEPGDARFAARMRQLAERLDGVCSGAGASALEPWMEELYRRVSDRQTMGTVVGELRVTLGEVEQHLDQFFRQPADPAVLAPVPGQMAQMRGVLSVLGLEQAALAVARLSDAIVPLAAAEADPEAPPPTGLFERIGNSLGALGLQIDMLGYQPLLARKLFVYDEASGELRYTEAAQAGDAADDGGLDAGEFDPSTRAADLLGESQPVEPARLEQIATLAAIDERPALAQAANRAVEAAREQDANRLSAALEQLQAAARPVTVLPAAAPPDDDDRAADDEDDLLDIFLEEAREVVQSGQQALRALAAEPGDLEQQTTLRRAFHTLKGSSRMVGLAEFGAAAWSMEQLLNAWLAEQKPVSDELRGLAGEAIDGFGRWIDAIAGHQAAPWQAAPFRETADALRLRGQRLPLAARLVEPAPAAEDAPRPSQLGDFDLPDLDLPEPESGPTPAPQAAGVDLNPFDSAIALGGAALAAEPPGAADAAEPAALPSRVELLQFHLGDLSFLNDDQGDAEAATGAASEPLRGVSVEVADAGPLSDELLAEFQAAGLPATPEVQATLAPDGAPPPSPYVTASETEEDAELYKQIGELRISAPLYNVYLNEADDWSRQLMAELADWALEPDRPVPELAMARAHALAGSSATVGFAALSGLARAVEHALQRLVGQPRATAAQARVLGEAAEDIRRVLHQFAAGLMKPPSEAILAAVQAIEPTDAAAEQPVPAETAVAAEAAPRHGIGESIDATDAVDPDLFPIFEEEAQELLPRLSAALRGWAGQADDQAARGEALRALHTLKGSARLAGALRLGEMAHRIESAIEAIGAEGARAQDVEPLLDHLDELQENFRKLQDGGAGVASAGAERASMPPADETAPETPAPQASAAPAPVARGEVAEPAALSLVTARAAASQAVRVRAQLLDRMLNQAGEMMTARARMEVEAGRLRGSLGELTGNLERLRQQLRDVELQAETQMQSRLAQSKDAQQNFDPLEFDRFTRMQELTRMMAESVNDVATVQRSLQRALEASEDDLAAQARQSRELQRDLLRTRMVEFESLSERLYRVVRQTAKEAGKQVRLDIVGGAIEIDRSVLERMTPAFEHLLRNCVVHGIEPPEARDALGKDPVGAVTVTVHQAGNDVAIEFRDDGAGLDLARLRERALQKGLLAPEQAVTDAELRDLVFLPGFTTATEVTELAGRGVGMDVVRIEVQAIGGRIETDSTPGQGAAFRLILPLTTAVTHIVMVRADRLAVGVPSNLIEIVRRVPVPKLQAAYESGRYRAGGEDLPFYWAGALLQGSGRSSEPPARTAPVAIFRSADRRIAVHVDEVLGNQEVVVKGLGPQLARLPGLVAMTALASGAVALIYNLVALATVYGEQARALSVAAAALPPASAPAGPAAGAAAAPSDIPLVLVVDDSITVRRVTQRLLQREGYRVALAADGLQGLEQLQAERPAVVLSDIEMPRMDGFDFVRNIRADEKLRDLPVIMITSRIAAKHRDHARELGVDHYLGKPYAGDELLGLIKGYTRVGVNAAG